MLTLPENFTDLQYAAQMISAFAEQLMTGKPFEGEAFEALFGEPRNVEPIKTVEAIEHWARTAREILTKAEVA